MFDLKVGFSCNNNCIHCVVDDKKGHKDLTTDQIKAIILNRVPKDEDTITFTGGEASIRDDFLELIQFAKNTGRSVFLQTNGTGFADPNLAKAAAPYLDHVLLAIHSSEKEVHNAIVRHQSPENSASMFDLTIQGFKNLAATGVNLHTQTVISKLNMATLLDTFRFIQSVIPGKSMNLTYPHPMGGAYKNWQIVCPKFSELKPYLDPVLREFHSLLAVEAIPMCYTYPFQDKLEYYFDVYIKRNILDRKGLDYSNAELASELIASDGYSDNYNLNDIQSKRKGPKCRECVFNERCLGVWKEYMEFYKTELDLFPVLKDESITSSSNPAIIIKCGTCLNSCLFCGGGPDGLVPDLDAIWAKFKIDADYFISQKDRGTEIELSGEPGQYPRIVDCVKYLSSNGFTRITLSTHGRNLKDPELVKSLKDAGLTRVRIPLYGATANIHNKSTQVNRLIGNAFEDTIAGLQNCADQGISIIGTTIVTAYNKDTLEDIIKLIVSIAKDNLEAIYINAAGIGELTYSYTRDWFVPTKDLSEAILKIADNPQYDPLPILFIDIPYCVFGRYDDRASACYNVPNIGAHKILNGKASEEDPGIPHYRIKERIPVCASCDLREECSGIARNEIRMFGYYGLKAVHLN